MRTMFLHPAFPAQFGLLAHYLAAQHRWPCVFVTSVDTSELQLPFVHINYRLKDDVPAPKTFTNPNGLEGLMEHLAAIYRGLRGIPDLKPDLVVGHMSYGTMLYLRNLYACPFVGFYDLLPPAFWGNHLSLRKEFPAPEGVCLFNATFHTMTHLHLAACDAAYTSTEFQRSTAPKEWQHKITVLHEGIDCNVFTPRKIPRPTTIRGKTIDADTKVVTYVSRGLESFRGFDIFMKMAKRLCDMRSDVLCFVVGAERTSYGHERYHIGEQSFKQWVLAQDTYDLDRIVFLDLPQMQELSDLYNLSDLHVHLTVPYPISPSLIQAMASGCTILASDVEPVREHIDHRVHGLLSPFEDVNSLVGNAMYLLDDAEQAEQLAAAARKRVEERYEVRACLEKQVAYLRTFGEQRGEAIDTVLAGLKR